jgi:hypothetical protein
MWDKSRTQDCCNFASTAVYKILHDTSTKNPASLIRVDVKGDSEHVRAQQRCPARESKSNSDTVALNVALDSLNAPTPSAAPGLRLASQPSVTPRCSPLPHTMRRRAARDPSAAHVGCGVRHPRGVFRGASRDADDAGEPSAPGGA